VIVLIEDEVQIRRFLRAALTVKGIVCSRRPQERRGWRRAATRQPELIILDLGLPDLDGFEVIRRLREWGDHSVIILSARGQGGQDRRPGCGRGRLREQAVWCGRAAGADALLALRHAAHAGSDPGESTFLRGRSARRPGPTTGGGSRKHRASHPHRVSVTRHAHPTRGKILTHKHLLTEVWRPPIRPIRHSISASTSHNCAGSWNTTPPDLAICSRKPGVGYRLASE